MFWKSSRGISRVSGRFLVFYWIVVLSFVSHTSTLPIPIFYSNYSSTVSTGQITIADLFLYQANTSYSSGAYDGIPTDVLSGYASIQRVVSAVKAHPAVEAWENNASAAH
jgi:hypothetical protein